MDYLEEIQKVLRKHTDKEITIKTTFRSIGVDSLDLMHLIIKYETKYNIHLEDGELLKIKNVGDLIAAFKKNKDDQQK